MDTQDNGGIAYCDDRHGCHSADDVSSRKQQRKILIQVYIYPSDSGILSIAIP